MSSSIVGPQDLTITLSSGLTIAAQLWSNFTIQPSVHDLRQLLSASQNPTEVFLALHGWLDNSSSFSALAPLVLQECKYKPSIFLALDFIGHGKSDWRRKSSTYWFLDLAREVVDVQDSLGIQSCNVIAHSMGGAISTILAGTYPERFKSFITLDSLGPFAASAQAAPTLLRKGIDASLARYRGRAPRFAQSGAAVAPLVAPASSASEAAADSVAESMGSTSSSQPKSGSAAAPTRRTFPSFDAATKRLVQTYTSGLGLASAKTLARRGCEPVVVNGEKSEQWKEKSGKEKPEVDECDVDVNGFGLQFSYDLKLIEPSLVRYTEDQCYAFLKHISCPVLVLWASKGFPYDRQPMQRREAQVPHLTSKTVEGGHHFHMDNVEGTMAHIRPFLAPILNKPSTVAAQAAKPVQKSKL